MMEDRFDSPNFNRPPRLQFPPLKDAQIEIPAPPGMPIAPDQNLLVSLLPILGIGVMAMFYVFRALASNGGESVFFAVPMFFLAVFTIAGTVMAQRWRRSDYERRRRENEIGYIRLLEKKRARLQAVHDAQAAILNLNFPSPDVWLERAISRDIRLWERRPQDDDFACFRLGIGRVPSAVEILTPSTDTDSHGLEQALSLADTYRFLKDVPVLVSLREDVSVGIYGRRALVLQMARTAICHLAGTHAPQDLHIHLIAPQAHYDDWRWLEWLPHVSQSHRGGAADLIAFDTDHIRNLMGILGQVIDQRKEEHKNALKIPHLLLIIDGPQLVESEAVYSTILREGGQLGASAICLVNTFENLPSDCATVVEIHDNGSFELARTTANSFKVTGQMIDSMSVQDAEHTSRALASLVIRETGAGGRIPRQVDFLDLYGVHFTEALMPEIHRRWRRAIPNGVLPHPVMIGRESLAVSTEILLDEDHHGPHGVLAGTTGSGKSELLQTLICSMVIEHDPRLLNLLLIDFKGGSTFNVFAGLPHTVGLVTNLDGTLIERALEALRAEIEWRQQFLKTVGMRDVTQYHRYFARTDARVLDPAYRPLPHLIIIVDEFAQLAKEMPNFMHELVKIAQIGRSLGIHLILGTQSPMDVITDEMNANLQFRICLRVQNIEASRAMLRRPDAAYLPAGWPGRGYFQVGEQGVFKQFQTAYAGMDYIHQEAGEAEDGLVLELITDTGAVINLLGQDNEINQPLTEDTYTTARAICDTVIQYAQSQHTPWMRPLLLPPLETRITLDQPLRSSVTGGWNGRDWTEPVDMKGSVLHPGSAPVGMLDDVYNRNQRPLWINTDEHEKDGHVLIIGGPGSGKTMFLRTLAISQAMLHSPDQLHMYFLSFTGPGLDELGKLPHSERVIYGTEGERVRRLFGRLIHLLNERQSRRTPLFEPLVMLFIDQYEQLRDSFRETYLPDFERLITEGRAVGIYVVLTASSVGAIPDRLRALVQQRIALQLGDSGDYLLAVGRLQSTVEGNLPAGRGFFRHTPPLICQVSLPCLKPLVQDEREVLREMNEIIRILRIGYGGQAPTPIEELPTTIPLHTLPVPQKSARIVTPLGQQDDDHLRVFNLDWWEAGSHFLVTGPPGSGKTSLLQTAVLSAAQQFSPQQMRFLLIDFTGRKWRSFDSLKHVITHVYDVPALEGEITRLGDELRVFDKGFQHGQRDAVPATVVVIDDYDSVSEALRINHDLFVKLREYVRLHTDTNFYLWIGGYLERIGDPLIKHLLLRRSGFGLVVKESLHRLNIRTTGLPNDIMPPGRAFWAQENTIQVIQTALVEDVRAYIDGLNHHVWRDAAPARWESLPSNREVERVQAGRPKNFGSVSLDIDTEGLIDDLLGDDGMKG